MFDIFCPPMLAFVDVFMFIYDLSIFLTSTAFVSTNAKIRHTSFEIYRISENCPLGYNPNT